MRLSSINDITFESIKNSSYDLGIFASGYESRCQFVSEKLEIEKINRQLVFGFECEKNNEVRSDSDNHFKEKWNENPKILSTENDLEVYSVLNNIARCDTEIPKRILIDYSSMSRTWYAAILNWIRFQEITEDVIVDFIYSAGSYYSTERLPISVKNILPLPGCDGASGTATKSIAVFGLGFEGLALLCVLDKLQPDEIFTYLASPAFDVKHTKNAREKNNELINIAKETIELPLFSVEITFLKLAEVISPYLNGEDITFVPMGPKPHVLAAILLAIHFKQITCLHVNGSALDPSDVIASGKTVSTRLLFKPEFILPKN